MFTTKYLYYEPAPAPADCTSDGFTPCERIDGPYNAVSARWEGGRQVVRCDNGSDTPGMTFGPVQPADDDGPPYPRPTLWVMNAQGSTIATYHL